MWSYLTLLLVPAGAAIASRLDARGRTALYAMLGTALTLGIGSRYHVGCDWNAYLLVFVRAQSAGSLPEALTVYTPGYMLINWLAARAGMSIAAVNTFCALVLVTGLLAFSSSRPKPWLAFLIAIPVLVILAGFSATRQATAIGFFLCALYLHLQNRRPAFIVALMLVAATFHASALLTIPLLLLMRRDIPARGTVILLLSLAAGLAGAIFASTVPPFSTRLADYPPSGGAWFRAVPTAMALIAYAIVRRRTEVPAGEQSMLFWLAAFSLFYLPLGLASTTIMDRVGWYAVPFQIAALTRVTMLVRSPGSRLALNSAVSAPFVLLFVGWLGFGFTASCLIPYQSHFTDARLLLGDNAARHYKYNDITDPWHLVGVRGLDEGGNAAHPDPGS